MQFDKFWQKPIVKVLNLLGFNIDRSDFNIRNRINYSLILFFLIIAIAMLPLSGFIPQAINFVSIMIATAISLISW